jgi:hypothetical protein
MAQQDRVGFLVQTCAAKSRGAYVLIRSGQRLNKHTQGMEPEYRVNVRPLGTQSELTASAGTLEQALERAAQRLVRR